ncbi:MAG: hypothetical protein LBI64_04485 [Coriobacteriales bacterium]|jgi:hypothetical protein|nr:hypothetical protein [Coriobacteriales bacterium]
MADKEPDFVHVRIGSNTETVSLPREDPDEDVILIGAPSTGTTASLQHPDDFLVETPVAARVSPIDETTQDADHAKEEEDELLVPMSTTQRIIIIVALLGVVVVAGFLIWYYFLR